MKTTTAIHRNLKSFIIVCAALFLAAAGITIARAQRTNDTVGAKADPADVSHFPNLDQLPGKVPAHVWTGLANVWARDHVRWKNTATNDAGAVVFLGDSITEGWRTLTGDFPNLHVANRGIGGDITSGVLYRLQSDVLSLDPAAIVLLIGTNDIGNGADPEDVAANIQLILMAIKNFNPNMKVIVCEIMPTEDGKPGVEKIKQANALIAQYVKTEPNFAMCDTFDIYLDEQGHQIAADFRPDHLHPVAAGYVAWKQALDPLIAKLNISTGTAK
jgi:lysophospholipase L1-like esterase